MRGWAAALVLAWAALAPQGAGAVLTIKITQGMEGAQPIATIPIDAARSSGSSF